MIMAGQAQTKTYVLVHGAWHGGWCWRDVASRLRALGHHVTTPTQTGVGERRHLLSHGITLDVFVSDIVNHIESEDLTDVILVGHSLGGASITGTADRIPDRIRHLVYLDAAIVESDQSVFSTIAPEIVAKRRKLAADEGQGIFLPIPPLSAFGIPEDHPLADWVRQRLSPQPIGTFETTLKLRHPVGNGRPRTYVACTEPLYRPAQATREWVSRQSGWKWQELATGHDAMILAPADVCRLLAAID
jgi:pimeloyl-ACP methyl ester carboxylesterase